MFIENFNKKIEIIYHNDLYINGKKFGGILVESMVINNTIKYIIVGIGINNLKSRLDDSLNNIATSFYEEYNECFDEKLFLNKFFEKFEEKYL